VRLVLAEEPRDGPARRPLDLRVDVDDVTSEPLGDLLRERRLARPHEADERDVLL
jgi:hypothetical protein